MADKQIVNLDIGGVKYRTFYSTLTSVPGCMLASFLDEWTKDRQEEVFIDRDGKHFRYILNYLRVGVNVTLPEDFVVLKELGVEAQFYQLHHLAKLVEKKIGCTEKQAQTQSSASGGVKSGQQSNVDEVKVEQNGERRGDSDNSTAAFARICTNAVCVRQGKCGVLQHSDQHMAKVWMCSECYCTIALPQQQGSAAAGERVDSVGTGVTRKHTSALAHTSAQPTSSAHKKRQSPVPGPSKPVVRRSPKKKPAVHCVKKRTQQTHKKQSTAAGKTIAVANGGTVLACGQCEKRYTNASMLEQHVKTKHTVTDHQCHICNKYFAAAQNLKVHMATVHEGVKRHQCPTCGKAFGVMGHLVEHIKSIHEGQKFACDECGKQFNRQGSLKDHASTHSGAKPYVCDVCAKGFSVPGSLTKHRNAVHLRIKAHQCPLCEERFAQTSNMKTHMHRVHSDTSNY